jgi:NAD(P)-dependent dehydrogenase (short-subunit alcohol dehydrogenase family)
MNILFTRELARRAAGDGITATCFHPGVVRTGFGKNDGLLYRAALTAVGPFLRSPAKGAQSLVWLALDPAAAELTGVYVVDEQVRDPSAAARDAVLAEGLWERSVALTAA